MRIHIYCIKSTELIIIYDFLLQNDHLFYRINAKFMSDASVLMSVGEPALPYWSNNKKAFSGLCVNAIRCVVGVLHQNGEVPVGA